MLFVFAQSYTEADVAMATFEGYAWLTILIPVMVFLIALFLLIALFILSSMSDKLTDIKEIMNGQREVEEDLADSAAVRESDNPVETRRATLTLEQKIEREKANTRSIFLWGAVVAVPLLLIVLILINILL